MNKKNYYDEIYYLTDVREKLSKNTPYRFLMQIEGQDSIELVKLSEYEELQQRINKAINDIDTTIEIIKEQPTGNDDWILSKLNSARHILQGEDK